MTNLKIKKGASSDLILEELWEDSVFNKRSYEALESFTIEKSQDREVSIPTPEIANALTASRNRNLIKTEQQDKLKKTVVAFFGLSVGSHAALTWMMESRADTVKIIDPDIVSPTNLNRLRMGWEDVGKAKTKVVEEQLYKINPFTKVISYKGTDLAVIEKMFEDTPPINIVVDAIDDMKGKIALRKYAEERKLILLSAADVGDNVVLDIERYDVTPQAKPFLGRVPDLSKVDFAGLSDLERRRLIINLVGFEKNSEDMLGSLLNIGEELGTWPQLGATATIAGGVVVTAIKKIILGENVKSGRYYICLDDILVADFNSNDRIKIRSQQIQKIKEKFNLK